MVQSGGRRSFSDSPENRDSASGWSGTMPTPSEIEAEPAYQYIFDQFKERAGDAIGTPSSKAAFGVRRENDVSIGDCFNLLQIFLR